MSQNSASFSPPSKTASSARPLVLEDVSFLYPKSEAPVLDHVSIEVRRGEFLGIVGPTGSGKSTLLSVMAGIIPHYIHGAMTGEVLLQGVSTHQLSLAGFAVHVSMVLQDPESQLFNLLVRDELVWGLENRGVERERQTQQLRDVLKFFRIEKLEERITYDLSGGEKQRVAIAAAYISRPEILLLDNPTSQLDPRGAALAIESIRRVLENHQTVVMVEDKIDELVEHADRLLVMDKGRIVLEGTPLEICRSLPELEAAGLYAPQVPELVARLRTGGRTISGEPLTVEEAVPLFKPVMRKERLPRLRASDPAPRPADGQSAIEVKSVLFTYPPPHETPAIRGVSFEVPRASLLAIVGQNGSGKTTLARCMSGYLKPTSGQIHVSGRDVHQITVRERAKLIGYVFQNPETQLFKNSALEDVVYGLRNLGARKDEADERARTSLTLLNLWDKRDVHPFRLSYGDKQRLAIATIAALEPSALIIDEPTTGQDHRQAHQTMRLLEKLRSELGVTVIVITHAMPLAAEYCDRIVVMCEGEILLDGPPRDVFAEEKTLAKTFVEPPPVTRLAIQLGLNPVPLTVAEAVHQFAPLMSREAAS
ncbi:MAG: ABC transporter ATP-binding protein [Chloroflexi bacterium]|nr:MAG: ABC transporter ATP-binding protein [Chloroflexota bacterium]